MKTKWIWILAGVLVLAAAMIGWKVVIPVKTSPVTAQTVTFQTADGLTVTGDLYLTDDLSAPFLLLCHQAGYSRGEYLEIAPKLNKLGYNCLAIDQRSGRGVNGVTNETNKAAQSDGLSVGYVAAYPDLEAALAYLIEQYHPKQLIAWGSSYSASLVLILAAEHPNDVQAVLSFSPGEYFSFNDQHIKDYAKKITQPVFITSSKSEAPAWRDIAGAISSKGCVFFVPQGSGVHGSSALMEKTKNNAEYWTAVEDFLKSLQQS
ncbi:MAG: alpha/beta fold hydrolase [Christensenella sp.]|nr:alpha/beta fold hydrolase [Christensenella sp.]